MADTTSGLVVSVVELLRRPGMRRSVQSTVQIEGLSTDSNTIVDNQVEIDLDLEASASSIVASGAVRASWQGECRRCLKVIEADLEVDVHEVFERSPTEGETYPLGDADEVDLEEMVRDNVVLALPLAPLCDSACAGPDPDAYPVTVADDSNGATPPTDPRWAALGGLHFDDDDESGGDDFVSGGERVDN